MVSSFTISNVLLLLSLINSVVITAVPESEYYTMLSALRFGGYHLFANAITTTDLHYDIIYGSNFTFFAPIDSALYALDMSMSASDYIMTLRLHVVPRRMSVPDLRMLRYGVNSLPTLVPGHDIQLVNRLPLQIPITVEGVEIAVPGMFYDSHIAVHGLEGIIGFRSQIETPQSNLTGNLTTNLTINHGYQSTITNLTNFTPTPSPDPSFNSTGNDTIAVPMTAPPPLSTNLTGNQTVASPVAPPERSFVSSLDISVPLAPWHNQPAIYSASTNTREEHMSIEASSNAISRKTFDVSLAMKSTSNAAEEFTIVDDKIVDCPFNSDNGDQLNIADIRHGYLYTRELYTPSNMSCAQ